MFEKLTRNACQRNRAVIAGKRPVALLKQGGGGQILARDHSLGISPVSIDCWKRWANTGPNSIANSFRTPSGSSGPKALDGLRPLRSLVTPFISPEEGSVCIHF